MKTLITLLAALIFGCTAVQADELTENLKFGHPTKAEMELTEYAPEPDAPALVLCALRKEYYTYSDGDFVKVVEHKKRIKVLKPEGVDYANVSCLYHNNRKDNSIVESVSNVSATAYNLEAGKTVATKMKSDLVFRERINDDVMMLKFTVPQVKVGTVIEYAYTERSNNSFHIDDWFAQGDIPVLYTRFTIAIPVCFIFAAESTGVFHLEASNEEGSIVITEGRASATLKTFNSTFIGRNVPSLRDDDAVWCIDDYRAKVTFEFQRTEDPLPYKSYTSTWEEIGRLLMEDSEFGGRFSGSVPLKAEVAALQLDTLATVDDRVAAVYTLLASRVKWDGNYTLYSSKRPAAVLKDGTGTSADVNFMLIGMLREAGIEAWPVLIRMRHHGHLPVTHPSLKKMDTFVVAFRRDTDDKGFIDAASATGYVDVVRPQLMTDRGLIVGKDGIGWMDLSEKCSGREVTRIAAEVRPDGTVVGERTNYYFQLSSLLHKESMKDVPSADVVEKLERNLEAKVTDYSMEGDAEAFSSSIVETYTFEKAAQSGGDVIYVNPFVFQIWDANPFTNEKRSVPVERPAKITEDYAVALTIPEGYDVEELPKSLSVKSPDGSITCRVMFSRDGDAINVTYRYQVKRLFFGTEEYADLREIYNLIYAKCNEMIAIRKR